MMLRTFALCLLIWGSTAAPMLHANDTNPSPNYGIDLDDDDFVAAQVAAGLAVGGLAYLIYRGIRAGNKSKKARQDKGVGSLTEKPKLNLYVDAVPQQRWLTGGPVDVDYRIGVSIKLKTLKNAFK